MIFFKNFLIFAVFSVEISANFNIFFEKLDKVLKYCIENPENVDAGTILGVTVASGQLGFLKNAGNLVEKLKTVEKNFQKLNKNYKKADFFNSTLFAVSFPVIYGALRRKSNLKFSTVKNYVKNVNDPRNEPQGRNSDGCLNEIFEENCRLSRQCEEVEDVGRKAFGYQLTHKLIYHLLSHIRCQNENFHKNSQKICSEIHQEARFVHEVHDLLPASRDLFMEQIFLCSFVGFGEFLDNRWITDMLSWQLTSGCFSYDGVECSAHMNGLAVASLMYFGKVFEGKFQ